MACSLRDLSSVSSHTGGDEAVADRDGVISLVPSSGICRGRWYRTPGATLPPKVTLVLRPWGPAIEGIQINPIDVPYRQDEIARIENGELRVTLEGKLLESIRDGATICFIDYYR